MAKLKSIKKLKFNYFFVLLIFNFYYTNTNSQIIGDYRSIASGNWSATTTWEYYNGTTWTSATKYPGQVSGDQTITIQSPNIVTWNLSFTPNQIFNLTINSGATLQDMAGAFYYRLDPISKLSILGTISMSNTSDATSIIYAGNIQIASSGILTAHKIFGGIVQSHGNATITDVIGPLATWYNQEGSVLNFGGVSVSGKLYTNSFVGNTVNYNSNTAGQAIASPIDGGYYNLTLSGTGVTVKYLTVNTNVAGTLSIQGSSRFYLGGYDLFVSGDWNNSSTNSASFYPGTNSVSFNGTSQQNIVNSGHSSGTTFYNLNFSNTSTNPPQVVLSLSAASPVLGVTNQLTMSSGIINLNGFVIQLGSSYSTQAILIHSKASSAGWCYGGTFYRYFQNGATIPDGSLNGLFPVGTSADFRPFYISCPLNGPGSNTAVATLCNESSITNIVNITDTGGPIVRQHQAYWSVSKSGFGGSFNINAGGTGFGTVGNINDLRLSQINLAIGNAGINSGTTSFPLVQRTGLTSSDLPYNWYLGSVDPVSSPLPVQLTAFSGKAILSEVDLEWETQSEINNSKYTILRSVDGKNFSVIGTLDGNGTTNENHKYHLRDLNPSKGNNYYRLEQTDINLNSEVLATIVVELKGSRSSFEIYPNPVKLGDPINLIISDLQPDTEHQIQVVDLNGKLKFCINANSDATGRFRGELNASLSPGIYIIRLGLTVKKLLVIE